MDDIVSIAVSNAVAASVLALLAIAVTAAYRRPALVHGLWLLVLLKLVTPPLVFLPIAWPAASEAPPPEIAAVAEEPIDASQPGEVEPAPPLADPPPDEEAIAGADDPGEVDALGALTQPRSPHLGALTQPRSPLLPEPPLWPQLLRIVWAFGAVAWFVLALERLHHFRRLLRFSRPASSALQQRTRRLAQSLGLRHCPRVRLLPGRIAPMLWAVGGPPRLLVPAELLPVLNDEQLDTLLLHELAHLRRRDHWVRILEFVVMGLYWWHPIVWYARRELREAEEQCCDAWVVSTMPGAGRTYASALLDTLDFLSTTQAAVPPLASGLSQIADLKRRLTMILRENTPRSLTWPGCLAVAVLGLTFLPMLPALQGQQPSKEEQDKSVSQEEKAKSAVEAAKAELEARKAQLELQKAALKQAEAQLKATIVKMEHQKEYQKTIQQAKLQRQQAIRALAQNRRTVIEKDLDAQTKPTIHITIEVDPEEKAIHVRELLKKLQEVLPQKGVRIHFATTDRHRATIRSGDAPLPVAPAAPRPPVPPKAAKSPPSGQEKRINDLEKKLEKVLRELQEMKKQMKQSRGRAEPTPLPAVGRLPRGRYSGQRGNNGVPTLPTAPAAVPPPPGGEPPDQPSNTPPTDPTRR